MQTITIALTKGRLEQAAIELFEQAGIDCRCLADKNRQLIFESESETYRFMLVKAADVITYVHHGVADLGVVGKDVLLEQPTGYLELLDLQIGRCYFAVASTDSYAKSDYRRKIIDSKYPQVTANFFSNRGEDVEIIKIEGSVEVAPVIGLADAIVDLVETGATLQANGLKVYEKICDISGRLIANEAALKRKRQPIFEIITRLQAILN